jgi:hypothetical protein
MRLLSKLSSANHMRALSWLRLLLLLCVVGVVTNAQCAVAFVQKSHTSTTATGTTLVLTAWTDSSGTGTSGNITAGTAIALKVWYEAGDSTVSVADTASNTWTEDASVFINDGGTRSRTFKADNVAGASALQITITFGTSVINRGAIAFNVSGVASTAYIGGGHIDRPPTNSTTTDALLISATPASQPALVVGLARDFPGDVSAPAFGTVFTDHGTGINLGGVNGARLESKRVTSTSALNVTFTAGFGSHDYHVDYFIFAEASGGTVVNPISGKGGAAAFPITLH